jgi:2-hydroxy-3-keto-5-methylthiopentenyl-1-phosphate phosphatase
LTEGYYTIYIGDGLSDISSAKIASKVFAIGDLLERCREYNIRCTHFNDFFDVIRELKTLIVA